MLYELLNIDCIMCNHLVFIVELMMIAC